MRLWGGRLLLRSHETEFDFGPGEGARGGGKATAECRGGGGCYVARESTSIESMTNFCARLVLRWAFVSKLEFPWCCRTLSISLQSTTSWTSTVREKAPPYVFNVLVQNEGRPPTSCVEPPERRADNENGHQPDMNYMPRGLYLYGYDRYLSIAKDQEEHFFSFGYGEHGISISSYCSRVFPYLGQNIT